MGEPVSNDLAHARGPGSIASVIDCEIVVRSSGDAPQNIFRVAHNRREAAAPQPVSGFQIQVDAPLS